MLNNNRINQIDSFNKMHIHIQQLISLKPLFGQVETQQWPTELQFVLNFLFVSLCSFICLQAVYQLLGPVFKSTWRYNSWYSCFSPSFHVL